LTVGNKYYVTVNCTAGKSGGGR